MAFIFSTLDQALTDLRRKLGSKRCAQLLRDLRPHAYDQAGGERGPHGSHDVSGEGRSHGVHQGACQLWAHGPDDAWNEAIREVGL